MSEIHISAVLACRTAPAQLHIFTLLCILFSARTARLSCGLGTKLGLTVYMTILNRRKPISSNFILIININITSAFGSRNQTGLKIFNGTHQSTSFCLRFIIVIRILFFLLITSIHYIVYLYNFETV